VKKVLTIQEFFKRFPDDDSCLAYLRKVRFGGQAVCPKCGKETKFHKLANLPAYGCQWCGHHIHPMVDTAFEDSHVPLQKWFYALYLFTTSLSGVSAKEIQRQLSVTYKTAWRMARKIRKCAGGFDEENDLS